MCFINYVPWYAKYIDYQIDCSVALQEMDHNKHFRSLLSVPSNHIMSELCSHGNLLTSSKTVPL